MGHSISVAVPMVQNRRILGLEPGKRFCLVVVAIDLALGGEAWDVEHVGYDGSEAHVDAAKE